MKNHVTYETSVRLKKAGFPQPEPEAGQFWYDLNGSMFVVYYEGGEGNCFLRLENGDSFACIDDGFVFAPTAADILRELGFPFYLIFDGTTSQWFLNNPDSELEIWKSDDPSEAAAKAFLNLKAKQ